MRRLLWFLALLVTVGVVAWLSPRAIQDDNVADTGSGANDPAGYVALDADLMETGADGQPLYRLLAERIERSSTGGRITLSKPRLDYQPDAQSHWSLQADHGELTPDSRQLTLSGAIVATGANAGDPPLTLRTEQLALDMQEQRADTDGRVHMEQQQMRLNAMGMHLNLRSLTWTLDGDGHFTLHR